MSTTLRHLAHAIAFAAPLAVALSLFPAARGRLWWPAFVFAVTVATILVASRFAGVQSRRRSFSWSWWRFRWAIVIGTAGTLAFYVVLSLMNQSANVDFLGWAGMLFFAAYLAYWALSPLSEGSNQSP